MNQHVGKVDHECCHAFPHPSGLSMSLATSFALNAVPTTMADGSPYTSSRNSSYTSTASSPCRSRQKSANCFLNIVALIETSNITRFRSIPRVDGATTIPTKNQKESEGPICNHTIRVGHILPPLPPFIPGDLLCVLPALQYLLVGTFGNSPCEVTKHKTGNCPNKCI